MFQQFTESHVCSNNLLRVMYVSRTLCPTSEGCKYLLFDRKRLEPRVMSCQRVSYCHTVSFVMCIPDAKFEELCSNISRDIFDSVFECFSETIYDIAAFLIA